MAEEKDQIAEWSDTEPARLAAAAATVIVAVATVLGISLGDFDAQEITGLITSAIVVVGGLIAAFERVRALVTSPKNSREMVEGLATAKHTGTVPYKAERAAVAVNQGSLVQQIIPPALRAAAAAVGLPTDYIERFGVEATKIAIEAAKRPPTPKENLDHLKNQMG